MEVLCRCFEALRELIDNLDIHFITQDSLNEILDSVRIVLDGDALCQIPPDVDVLEEGEEGEDEDDEDDAFEHDSKLIGYVSDCISSICKK